MQARREIGGGAVPAGRVPLEESGDGGADGVGFDDGLGEVGARRRVGVEDGGAADGVEGGENLGVVGETRPDAHRGAGGGQRGHHLRSEGEQGAEQAGVRGLVGGPKLAVGAALLRSDRLQLDGDHAVGEVTADGADIDPVHNKHPAVIEDCDVRVGVQRPFHKAVAGDGAAHRIRQPPRKMRQVVQPDDPRSGRGDSPVVGVPRCLPCRRRRRIDQLDEELGGGGLRRCLARR